MSMAYEEAVVTGSVLTDASGYLGPNSAEFGVNGIDGTSIGFNDAMMGRHVLYLGGIGTGKTVGMTALIRSIRSSMTPEDAMIIFDTKGDYYQEFYTPGDAVVSSTQAGEFSGQEVWNLFSEFVSVQQGRSIEDQIFEVCGSLFSSLIETAGNNSYFAVAARDVFTALVTAIARDSPGGSNNSDIKKRISSLSIAEMQALFDKPGNEDLLGVKNYIARDSSNSSMAIVAFMQQAIQESFRSAFGEAGDFSIRRFIREKNARTLFFEYDIASGNTLAPVFKTMLDIAMKQALSRDRSSGRVFFILDEFALLPELKHLTDGLNFGRSLGLRFVVGTQNIRQVQEMYGEHLAASVLSAFGTVFSFRLFDGVSREFVRDRFGRNRKIVRFDSTVRTKGLNEMSAEGNVVEDWDLSALPVGTCIAALPDTPPVRFTFSFEGA